MKTSLKVSLLTVFIAILAQSHLAQAKTKKAKKVEATPAPVAAPAAPVVNDKKIVSFKSEATETVFENTKILKSVTAQNDDKSETVLTNVSHGLRKKAVFGLVAVRVYVLQLLAAQPEKLVKTEDGILASLKEAGPIQLHLTFLRNLPGDKISSSFKEGLEANKIDTKKLSPELEQALKEISSITEFKEKESFSITFTWSGDKATVYLTDLSTQQIKTITGPKEFADQLLSIWFGKPADSKLEDLKKSLLK